MTTNTNCEANKSLQPVAASDLVAVNGGLVSLGDYVPMGDRSTVGCGTMVLIDRMISIFKGRR